MSEDQRYIVGCTLRPDGGTTWMPYKCMFPEGQEDLEKAHCRESTGCTYVSIGTKQELLQKHRELTAEDFE